MYLQFNCSGRKSFQLFSFTANVVLGTRTEIVMGKIRHIAIQVPDLEKGSVVL